MSSKSNIFTTFLIKDLNLTEEVNLIDCKLHLIEINFLNDIFLTLKLNLESLNIYEIKIYLNSKIKF